MYEVVCTHLQVLAWASNHHHDQLDCPACTSKQLTARRAMIRGYGLMVSQPAPAEMNRSFTSKQSSKQLAGQPVASRILTTSGASFFTSETCFEPNSPPQTNPAHPSPCSNPISL